MIMFLELQFVSMRMVAVRLLDERFELMRLGDVGCRLEILPFSAKGEFPRIRAASGIVRLDLLTSLD